MTTSKKTVSVAVLPLVFALICGLGLLVSTAHFLADQDCWAVFLAAAVIAWPLWFYGAETTLFHRRVVIGHLAVEGGRLRKWFWRGTLTRILLACVSLVLAALLVALVSRLDTVGWIILFADVVVLAAAIGPLHKLMAPELRERQTGVVARRWPLLGINVLVLTIAFGVFDLSAGAVDTRNQPWADVAETAFDEGYAAWRCAPVALLAGVFETSDALTWHVAEVATSTVDDLSLRAVFWVLMLFHAGLLAYLFTRFQLGIYGILENRLSPHSTDSTISITFVFTILALAVPYLYASAKLAETDWSDTRSSVRELIEAYDPCLLSAEEKAQLLARLGHEIQAAEATTRAMAEARIDSGTVELIGSLEPAVDAYLDWYFTVIAEYERLAAAVAGDIAETMATQFQKHVFENTGFAEKLALLEQHVSAQTLASMEAHLDAVGPRTTADTLTSRCQVERLGLATLSGDVVHDELIQAFGTVSSGPFIAAGGGALGSAVLMKGLAGKASASAASKALATKSFQAASALALKMAAKKGGGALLTGATAAAVCSPGGPAAIVCGVVGGLVAWALIDKTAVEIDEALNRDEMKHDILRSLNDVTPEVAQVLKQRQALLIDGTLQHFETTIERRFLPYRDGL